MVRVTSNMLSSNYLKSVNQNLTYMQKMQSQLSTGKEISKPSDDAYKASRIIQMYDEISNNEQYNANIKDVTNFLDVTDSSLTQMSNLLSRVRELMVSAGNAAYGSDQLQSIQDEMTIKVDQISQILNTSYDGKYIFGGTKVDSKPTTVVDGKLQYADGNGKAMLDTIYKDSTGKYTTNSIDSTGATNTAIKIEEVTDAEINEIKTQMTAATGDRKTELTSIYDSATQYKQIGAEMKIEISQGVTISYNQTASEILEFEDKENPGTTINLATLMNDIINNLGSSADSDRNKITSENLKDMDKVISNLLTKSSEVGAMQNRMESAKTQNESENYNLTSILSSIEDIDFTEKMIDYSTLLTVYKASLQISAKILPQTIMDYL